MANWIKYGKYYISGAITVGGVLWWSRPGDKMIRGEDYANIYEAVQERAVVPYLTGTDAPDWSAANESSTNSIDSRIQYADILKMANRIRDIVTKTDSAIFWTNEAITNHSSLAVSRGSYAITNKPAFTIDQAGTPRVVTNNVYSYTTNAVLDVIATTATRTWKTNSVFEYRMGSGIGYDVMTRTNLPLGNLVFGKGASTGLLSESLTTGAWWPFTRAYSYPWEQWNDVVRSRIIIDTIASENIGFTNNLVWAGTNSLSFSFDPVQLTNAAGYAMCQFSDVSGNKSVEIAYVCAPPSETPFYLSGEYSTIEKGYSINKAFTTNRIYILIRKTGAAAVSPNNISCEFAAGDALTSVVYNGSDTGQYIGFWPTKTNSLSVYKVTCSSVPEASPLFVAISIYGTTQIKTNAYFSVSNDLATTNTLGATATLASIAPQQEAKDDKRLLMSKLYDFRTSLTNLTRTVWIGGSGSFHATNAVEYITDITPENCWPYTNVWDVSRSGAGNFTPTYDTGYDLPTLRSNFRNGYDRVRTNSASTTLSLLSRFDFRFEANGEADVYSSGNWDSNTQVQLIDNSKSKWSYYGVTPAYPSLYAVTNGYVKKVKVFAVVEIQNVAPNNEYPAQPYNYSHSVSGNHIYSGNMGVSHGTLAISGAPDTIDTTIRKYNYADFKSASGGNSFVNESVLNLVYEVNNPTNKIMFDFEPSEFTHSLCDTYRYHFQQSAASSAGRAEDWSYDYSQYYEIAVTKWVVVVDWKFQNYGGYLFDIENQSVTVQSIETIGSNVVIVVTSAQVPLMPPVLQWKSELSSQTWSNIAATVTQVSVPAGVTNASRAYQISLTKPSVPVATATNTIPAGVVTSTDPVTGVTTTITNATSTVFVEYREQAFFRVRDNSVEY